MSFQNGRRIKVCSNQSHLSRKYRRRSKSTTTTTNTPTAVSSFEALSFGAFEGADDNPEDVYLRYTLYKCLWKRISVHLQYLQTSLHTSLVNQIGEFFEVFCTIKPNLRLKDVEIPVASIVTNLVGLENTILFNTIILKIQQCIRPSPYIVRLDVRSRPTIKLILQNLQEQLTRQNCTTNYDDCFTTTSNGSDDDDEDEVQELLNTEELINNIKLERLVVIIENIELLDPMTLSNLFRSFCCGRNNRFSIMLILGSGTGIHSWSDVIPQEVESCYFQREFHTVSADERFQLFLNVILDPRIPFRLSGSVLKYFKACFIQDQLPISRLTQAYQLCLMKHFQAKKESLCISLELYQKLRAARYLGSFRHNSHEEELLADYQQRSAFWFATLKFLFSFGGRFGSHHLGSDLSDLYILAWDQSLFQAMEDGGDSRFNKFVGSLSLYSARQLQHSLQNCLTLLKKLHSNDTKINVLCDAVQILINLKIQTEPPKLKLSELQTKTRGQFLEEARIHQLGGKGSDEIISKIKDFLRKFKAYLKPLNGIELSASFIFDDVKGLHQLILPPVQYYVHEDVLAEKLAPEKILACSSLYKLVLEQQILNISMDDLYQSFSVVHEWNQMGVGKKAKRAKIEDDDDQLNILKQTIMELQILGFLRSTKGRPHELVRQVWNS